MVTVARRTGHRAHCPRSPQEFGRPSTPTHSQPRAPNPIPRQLPAAAVDAQPAHRDGGRGCLRVRHGPSGSRPHRDEQRRGRRPGRRRRVHAVPGTRPRAAGAGARPVRSTRWAGRGGVSMCSARYLVSTLVATRIRVVLACRIPHHHISTRVRPCRDMGLPRGVRPTAIATIDGAFTAHGRMEVRGLRSFTGVPLPSWRRRIRSRQRPCTW